MDVAIPPALAAQTCLAPPRLTHNMRWLGAARRAQDIANPAMTSPLLAAISMSRFGEDADIVSAAVFLASDAAQRVTGQSLLIDGGYVAIQLCGYHEDTC